MEPSCNTSEGHLPFIDLPIIDVVRLYGRSGDVDRAAESQKLVDAFTNVGFCLLKNMSGIGRLNFRTHPFFPYITDVSDVSSTSDTYCVKVTLSLNQIL